MLVAERHRSPRAADRLDRLLGGIAELHEGTCNGRPERFTPLRQFTATCFPSRTSEAILSPTVWIISASAMNGTSSSGWKLYRGSGSPAHRSRPPTSIKTSNIDSISAGEWAALAWTSPGNTSVNGSAG